MYLVYLLKEKRTNKVLYVGSSARPSERMKEHRQAILGSKEELLKYPLYKYIRENGFKLYKDIEVIWVDVADDRQSMYELEAEYYYKYEDTVLNDRPAEDREGKYNPKRRYVKCLTDGKEFKTVSECAKYYGVTRNRLSGILNGYRSNTMGLRFLFKGKEV